MSSFSRAAVLAGGGSAGTFTIVGVGVGFDSTGVGGTEPLVLGRAASRFFSSVFRKTLIVVRSDLYTVQSSPETGECSQTGQDEDNIDWPTKQISSCRICVSGRKINHTILAYSRLTAWQPESIDGKLIAVGALQLRWQLVLSERAGKDQHTTGIRCSQKSN